MIYNVNDKFYLVDLPGYGYASSGHKDQNEWKDLIDKYFEVGKNINEIILNQYFLLKEKLTYLSYSLI